MSGSALVLGRGVVEDMVRLAALEVPGVSRIGRGGPPWRSWGRRSIIVRHAGDRVDVRVWVVARPGQPLGPLAHEVRAAIAAAVDRLLDLRLETATVVVDGIGG